MSARIIVSRYAEAYIAYCRHSIGIEKALADIKDVRALAKETPQFLEFLKSQEITFLEKCALLDKVLENGFSQEIKHFFKLLIEKNRIANFPDIAEYLRTKYGQEEEALLKTSFPLSLEVISEIENKVEKKFQKKFKFYIDLDPSLLGGIKLVIGNTVIDGSVRRRLQDLKETLMAARI